MIRLYIKNLVNNLNEIFELEINHFNYLINVMRLNIGDQILVFNPMIGEYKAKIFQINKKSCNIKLVNIVREPNQEKDLILAFAIIKPKKLEILIDMATQLGVTYLQPLLTDNVALHNINIEKLCSWVIESSEQSERLNIPEIKPLMKLSNFLEDIKDQFFIHANEHEKIYDIKSINNIQQRNILIVGPEGGWSDNEIKFFKSNNYGASITLGPNILRAETAVASLLSQYQLMK